MTTDCHAGDADLTCRQTSRAVIHFSGTDDGGCCGYRGAIAHRTVGTGWQDVVTGEADGAGHPVSQRDAACDDVLVRGGDVCIRQRCCAGVGQGLCTASDCHPRHGDLTAGQTGCAIVNLGRGDICGRCGDRRAITSRRIHT